MTTLLRVDGSLRTEGSHSRALADRYEELWLRAHPEGRVLRRDLGREPISHLDPAALEGFQEPGAQRTRSDELIGELEEAHDVLVSAPLYNFGPPSTLKAWVDHVVRSGRTFRAEDGRYQGLLGGRSVCLVTARGSAEASECEPGRFLARVFGFLGFERIRCVPLLGTAEDGPALRANLALARARIERLFAAPNEPRGAEAFVPGELDELAALRACQAAAIVAGDAPLYAELCTDDVQLLLQDRGLVQGRAAFLACEEELLRATRFRALRQDPQQLERHGPLAIEVGLQEVELEPDAAAAGSFLRRRKYVHVLRQTARGWRFAVLTSNNGA